MTSSTHQIPWIPLAKAVEKISDITRRHHSAGDVLAAALEGDLTLSVQINSPTLARSGRFQDSSEESFFGVSTKKLLSPGVGFVGIEGEVFAYSTNKGEFIQGLLDLLLIGNGRTHIENLQSGSQDHNSSPGGIYFEASTGDIWELQEQVVANNAPSRDHREFIPAERFRDDWRIVVRTSELERLVDLLVDQDQSNQGLAVTAAGQGEPVTESTAHDFKWGWPDMKEFTGLTRDVIRYRAQQLGYEIKRQDTDDLNSPPGLMIWQLNKIANYKRSNAVT